MILEKGQKIFKYTIRLDNDVDEKDQFKLIVPAPGDVIFVGSQSRGTIAVWVLVNENSKYERKLTFHVLGTGNPIQEKASAMWVGTVFDGLFVWHIFLDLTDQILSVRLIPRNHP